MKNYIRLFYADVEVGAKLTLDGAAANKTMKEFKQEIKAANEELLNTSARFGATSKEALAAAKRVAELKDNIQDANETAKLFDPGNKFQVLGNAVRGLVGGFTALQGALALVGVEGEEVQKTLLKVQGALALTEGLNTVADVTKDFKRLGSVLVQTLGKSGAIGLAIAGVTALGLAFAGVFNDEQKQSVTALSDSLDDYSRAAADARKQTTEVSVAIQQAKAGIISQDQALKLYNDTLGDSFGRTNDLATAEKHLADKAESYIKITGLKAQANALFAKSAQISADNLIQVQKEEKELAELQAKYGEDGNKKVFERFRERRRLAAAERTESAKEIDALAADLLRQAAVEAQSSGISSVPAPRAAAIKARVKAEVRLERELRAAETAALPEVNLESIEEQERLQRYADGIGQQMTLADRLQAQFKAQVEERIALAQLEEQQRTQAAYNIGSALGALSQLIGEQTAAGKAFAIAQAVINTWLGVTDVLKSESVLPQPLRTIQKIASIATVVATGLAAVRNIGKAKIPGKGGGGGGSSIGSVPAPIQARLPQATSTVIDQNQINQIGNATVRAFVVESDVSSNQERIRRLNRAARI